MAVSEKHFSQQLLNVIKFNCFGILNKYFRCAVRFLKNYVSTSVLSVFLLLMVNLSVVFQYSYLLSYTK